MIRLTLADLSQLNDLLDELVAKHDPRATVSEYPTTDIAKLRALRDRVRETRLSAARATERLCPCCAGTNLPGLSPEERQWIAGAVHAVTGHRSTDGLCPRHADILTRALADDGGQS